MKEDEWVALLRRANTVQELGPLAKAAIQELSAFRRALETIRDANGDLEYIQRLARDTLRMETRLYE